MRFFKFYGKWVLRDYGFRIKSGQKNKILKFYTKLMQIFSFFFYMKLQQHKSIQIILKKYSAVFGLKVPKMSFSKFYERLAHGIFLIFCIKLHQNKGLELT